MAQRQPIQNRLASNTSSTSRYKFRHSPESRRRALGLVRRLRRPASTSHTSTGSASTPPSSSESRQVLAPLQFNLRRLPSRLALSDKFNMRVVSDSQPVQVGMKRKRVVSGSENALGGRGLRSGGNFKRRRGSFNSTTTDDDVGNTMDIDGHIAFRNSDDSDEDPDLESSEDYLISEAPPRQLLRLRKDELLELYRSAGLTDDTDAVTKQDIVDAIVAARDDIADLPPSSPPGRDGNSSEYSSDEGNVAGGEETDINSRIAGPNGLRRRVTVHDLGRMPSSRPMKTRTKSLGHLEHSPTPYRKGSRTVDGATTMPTGRKRTGSLRSSPTTSMAMLSLPSPPATRLRSRKVSGEVTAPQPSSSSSSSHKAKGKAKQVEFSEDVRIASPAPEELSELTELSESEQETAIVNPSPRRLRSQDRTRISRRITTSAPEEVHPRTPPKRKAKETIPDAQPDGEEAGDVSDTGDEEEVDELVSSNSPTPPPVQARRTPLRRRLRPRRIQTHTPPSDGDDENEEEAEEEAEEEETVVDEMEEGDDVDAEGETDDEATETGSMEEDDATLVTPRKLRSGRVVSDERPADDSEEEPAEGSEEEVQDDMSVDEAAVDVEEGSEESEDDDGSDYDDSVEDVDLAIATARSLVRLRRDDLVRLCQTRALDIEGTKPQLAEALLQWREHQTETTAPSSTGTVRPPSTARPRANGRRKCSNSQTPPVLLRSHHVHLDEPRTPPLSNEQKEDELELDLESLGLDDREIPPDKLTKLEKIGSGGFKDVFVGKFKGRKVAIAEFRGQLNAMDIKELKLLGGFDHPNIVRFLGVSIPEDTRVTPVMIVSELCANGDLFDYVRNVPPPSLYRVLHMMLDIARGLEYLHLRKPSVIHRDCKSSNILITSKGVAKIADFGLAKVKQSTRSMVRSLVGTVNWQAPELWHPHPKYNHKVDVFACGAVYWEMLQWHVPTKKYPWEGMNEHAIYDVVGAKRQRPSVAGLRKQWCPEIVDLIERMWAHEHTDRPTMTEVVMELEGLVRQYR